MNVVSLIIATLMTLVFSAFVILLFTTIIFNLKSGEKYRKTLANRLSELRLGKMLGAVGIDINSYLHSESVLDIQQHMKRCADCDNNSQCDETLSEENTDIENIDFCNNANNLKKLVEKQIPGN